MEQTTDNKINNFAELEQYHRLQFYELFGESEGTKELFRNFWKPFKAELVIELMKQKSKYFKDK